MKIKIICVGKLKEASARELCGEYQKRLTRFSSLEIIELSDKKIPDGASAAQEEQVKSREGEDILRHIKSSDLVIALCVEGKQLSSEDFAKKISSLAVASKDTVFVIGGSLGLSDGVKKRADMRLSLSEMTLPHNLARLFLTEQIYRAFKINSNETYHK